jgi:hypothetical protein
MCHKAWVLYRRHLTRQPDPALKAAARVVIVALNAARMAGRLEQKYKRNGPKMKARVQLKGLEVFCLLAWSDVRAAASALEGGGIALLYASALSPNPFEAWKITSPVVCSVSFGTVCGRPMSFPSPVDLVRADLAAWPQVLHNSGAFSAGAYQAHDLKKHSPDVAPPGDCDHATHPTSSQGRITLALYSSRIWSGANWCEFEHPDV